MIEMEKVKAKYPDAVADCDGNAHWLIHTGRAHSGVNIGAGDSEASAWENAAGRIERKAVLAELVAYDQEIGL
jgi:hypothetical protein